MRGLTVGVIPCTRSGRASRGRSLSGRVITASGRERTMNGDRRTAFCRPAATEASPCNPPPGFAPQASGRDRSGGCVSRPVRANLSRPPAWTGAGTAMPASASRRTAVSKGTIAGPASPPRRWPPRTAPAASDRPTPRPRADARRRRSPWCHSSRPAGGAGGWRCRGAALRAATTTSCDQSAMAGQSRRPVSRPVASRPAVNEAVTRGNVIGWRDRGAGVVHGDDCCHCLCQEHLARDADFPAVRAEGAHGAAPLLSSSLHAVKRGGRSRWLGVLLLAWCVACAGHGEQSRGHRSSGDPRGRGGACEAQVRDRDRRAGRRRLARAASG